jgi:hypothetical protein
VVQDVVFDDDQNKYDLSGLDCESHLKPQWNISFIW